MGCLPLALVAVLCADAVGSAAQEPQPCDFPPLLPAYAHNDYRNRRPLHDALALGYRGVEADYVVVQGQLLVAHSRKEADPQRTLETLYLQPLRDRVRRCGRVTLDGSPFLLTIEAKEAGRSGYTALRSALLRYDDILRTVTPAGVRDGPVEVVLVGWHPPLGELAAESLRVVTVQRRITRGGADPVDSTGLVGLLSINYGRAFKWRGRGPPPDVDRQMFRRIEDARRSSPGVRIRAYNVPAEPPVYQLLLDSGVDLIGSKDLQRSFAVLCALTHRDCSRTSRSAR
jgi:hypothetical protein